MLSTSRHRSCFSISTITVLTLLLGLSQLVHFAVVGLESIDYSPNNNNNNNDDSSSSSGEVQSVDVELSNDSVNTVSNTHALKELERYLKGASSTGSSTKDDDDKYLALEEVFTKLEGYFPVDVVEATTTLDDTVREEEEQEQESRSLSAEEDEAKIKIYSAAVDFAMANINAVIESGAFDNLKKSQREKLAIIKKRIETMVSSSDNYNNNIVQAKQSTSPFSEVIVAAINFLIQALSIQGVGGPYAATLKALASFFQSIDKIFTFPSAPTPAKSPTKRL